MLAIIMMPTLSPGTYRFADKSRFLALARDCDRRCSAVLRGAPWESEGAGRNQVICLRARRRLSRGHGTARRVGEQSSRGTKELVRANLSFGVFWCAFAVLTPAEQTAGHHFARTMEKLNTIGSGPRPMRVSEIRKDRGGLTLTVTRFGHRECWRERVSVERTAPPMATREGLPNLRGKNRRPWAFAYLGTSKFTRAGRQAGR